MAKLLASLVEAIMLARVVEMMELIWVMASAQVSAVLLPPPAAAPALVPAPLLGAAEPYLHLLRGGRVQLKTARSG